MNKFEFEQSIVKLERAFKPLSKNSDERDEMIEIYYDRLKFTDDYILNKAIKYLQDNHEYRTFPLIAEILKAVYSAKESMRKEYHPGEECNKCQGTGWIITDCTDALGKEMQYTKASPCPHCKDGAAVKKACRIHDAKTGRQRHKVQLKETVQELTENLPDEKPERKSDYLSEQKEG